MFIVFEGLDGSGGTTQIGRLESTLSQRSTPCVRTREPSDGPVGRLIRAELAAAILGDAVFPPLFVADRRDHLDRVVAPALARGAWVLSDRYLLSSLAYQAAAVGFERVWSLNEGFRAPDLTIMLDLPVDVCLARVEARGAVRDRFETRDRLEATRVAYDVAIDRCRARGDRIVRIDAHGEIDAVAARVAEAVWPA